MDIIIYLFAFLFLIVLLIVYYTSRNKVEIPKKFGSPIEKQFFESWQNSKYRNKLNLKYQYRIPNTRYTGDFVDLKNRVIIELDGYKWHSSKEAFTKDREREREIEALGWKLIRFSGYEIYHTPDICVEGLYNFTKNLRENRGFLINLLIGMQR